MFDDYAADFQAHLVQHLGYQAHETLVRPLLESGRNFEAVLDLGCGTGLCGALMRPLASAIDGVDVSSAMLEQARAGTRLDPTHAGHRSPGDDARRRIRLDSGRARFEPGGGSVCPG